MPTLVRLFVILLVLVGLAYGAMFALVAVVEPNEKQVTVRIPARDLVPNRERDPLVQREIDTSRTADSPAPPGSEPAVEPQGQVPTSETAPREDAVTEMPPPVIAPADSETVTLQPGVE